MFSKEESIKLRKRLHGISGGSDIILAKLESMGYHSLKQLSDVSVTDIVSIEYMRSGAPNWTEKPGFRTLLRSILDIAKQSKYPI
ncbi:hypothetical protein [Yersinia sp. 2466 StPb PI]|uniref:hypothetical protein n=1 Tax=Yersinia sp. 2466 StPb PI TaxID=3061648 RepID=UPI00355C2601